ncbi:hypothetical protein [Dyadobacter fermentans]|uniref:Uncharacterized protein n=1 Tax=Dyadobacter fermentans (strain ATCC 700827 / DSM 18053 / CIP 107007 / KCTC 52180 / NS114) TaxID=471854 RepID=C6VZ69_DYAFD|nr:hypothetical protein [Dyadobacter fermentans]ACT95275.1 hypothetical protein Dfer_4072 [Dyadobacter fermentans DSM 18053]
MLIRLTLLWVSVVLWLIVPATFAQKPYFLIQSVKTKETIKVKKGQYLQCIQKNKFGQEEFVFGEVTVIRHDGIKLQDNPYIPGSGGFVFYEDIVNIDKIKLLKRSMLPACVAGIVIGGLTVAFQLSKFVYRPLEAVATYYVMYRAVKRKRRSLFENRVPEAVILIPPSVSIGNDRYFDPSSSLNHPE